MTNTEHLILGIESSCDETAAAVVADGRADSFECRCLAERHSPQIRRRGAGLASREHLRQIVPVVREAVNRPTLSFADSMRSP